ncbi:hypothetical protein N9W89_07740 [Hellea sp.]|nr:hypothetical protein [Hellea sp.]
MSGALSDTELLELYTEGRNLTQQSRMLLTLQIILGSPPERDLNALSLGDRDRCFWTAREKLSGTAFDAKIECQSCQEWMEISCGPDFAIPEKVQDSAVVPFQGEDYELRLPNISDLQAAKAGFPYERLNPSAPWQEPLFRKNASQALEKADPGMDVLFLANCENCESSIEASLDVFRFLWTDLQARAQSLLGEIITLARAFGWSETQCLSLPPARRRLYLEHLA